MNPALSHGVDKLNGYTPENTRGTCRVPRASGRLGGLAEISVAFHNKLTEMIDDLVHISQMMRRAWANYLPAGRLSRLSRHAGEVPQIQIRSGAYNLHVSLSQPEPLPCARLPGRSRCSRILDTK